MLETLLKPYKIVARLRATPGACAIVSDLDLAKTLRPKLEKDGHVLLLTEDVMASKPFVPQAGPYFVVTAQSEHAVKHRLRSILAEHGLHPEIYGALHDLTPMAAAGRNLPKPGGMEIAYEALRCQPAFAILCSPRSGSQYLARELHNHGFGHPLEHIRPPLIEMMKFHTVGRTGGFDFTHWFASLVRYGTENGIFGTKLISHFVKNFDKFATPEERATLDFFLQRVPVIYLLRTNKLMQALSRDRAKVTRGYHLFDEEKRGQYHAKSQVWTYDYARIAAEIRALHREETYLFKRLNSVATPSNLLMVDYEDMNIGKVVDFLRGRLHTPARPREDKLETGMLRDKLTQKYAELFNRDYAAAFREEDPTTHLPHRVSIDANMSQMIVDSRPDTAVFQ